MSMICDKLCAKTYSCLVRLTIGFNPLEKMHQQFIMNVGMSTPDIEAVHTTVAV